MIAYPACVPCLVNQGLNAVRKLNLGPEKEREIAMRAVKFLSQFDTLDRSPAYYAYFIQKIVKEIAGTEDPFKEQKEIANRKALELLPKVEEIVKAEEELEKAVRISALGNYIDFAIRGELEIEKDIISLADASFAVWDYDRLKERLQKAKSVFIIGDNAGEIVFDKPLVKVLKGMGMEVVYGVKGKPILNDATLEDAEKVSMTKLCKVVDNGSDKVGTWLEECSEEFLDHFYRSDVVISKGQANFETLSSADRDVFFLLVAKCDPIAKETGGEVRRFILRFKEQGAEDGTVAEDSS